MGALLTAFRKAHAIRKDAGRATRACPVAKLDEAKRIVYGVVLDPYAVDLQNDWSPPNEVEDAAHGWLAHWRMIGSQHERRSPDTEVVESYLFPYPTPADYRAACAVQPHRIFELQFGADVLHSGAWVLAVRLTDDAEWAKFLAGEYGAFSIRGFGERVPVPRAAMPQVTTLRIDALLGGGQ